MILGLEIGLFIAGIVALIKGKVTVSKNKVATGPPAYIAGAIMLLPIPLAIALIFGYGFILGARGGFVDPDRIKITAVIIEISVVAVCCIIAFGIAGYYGHPPAQKKRQGRRDRYEDEDCEDNEDRRDRRRRRDDEEDEEDVRPRSRKSRHTDPDSEGEDRPRRRPPPLPRGGNDQIKE